MAYNVSYKDLTFAWAAQVSLPQLAARLISYIESKASITAFRLAYRYTKSTAFRNLPEEVISMIANEVRNIDFPAGMQSFVLMNKCLMGHCDARDHISPDEIEAAFGFCTNNTDPERIHVWFEDEEDRRHKKSVEQWYTYLSLADRQTDLLQCGH
ncbi:MAG: hypothetical protein Q9218_006306, partial [Villophora microphyllina]